MLNVAFSVKELAQFRVAGGNLGHSRAGSVSAREGMAAHAVWQKTRTGEYRSEVAVKEIFCLEGRVNLTLRGRVDGLRKEAGTWIVEELKTSRATTDELLVPDPLHMMQTRIYAGLLAAEWAADTPVELHGVVVCPKSHATRVYREVSTAGAFRTRLLDLTESLMTWLAHVNEWRILRDASLASLPFPYAEVREGQATFMEVVSETISQGGRLVVEAPTGSGKTMSVLYPALRALAEGHVRRVFFLTAKNTGKAAVREAFGHLRSVGARIKTLEITAKETACSLRGNPCDRMECPGALGFYERVQNAVEALHAEADAWTSEVVRHAALRFNVCPYEFSLTLALWADVVVCDWNYALDPSAHLRRFFAEDKEPHALLFDEAHNLPDRARDMFTPRLRLALWKKASMISGLPPLFSKQLRAVVRSSAPADIEYEKTKHSISFAESAPEELDRAVDRISPDIDALSSLPLPTEDRLLLLECARDIRDWTLARTRFDDRYVYRYQGTKGLEEAAMLCLDPTLDIDQAIPPSSSAVYFSATLSPLDYYARLMGTRHGEARRLRLASPFPRENLTVEIAADLSTAFHARKKSLLRVVELIRKRMETAVGNGMVFFPSHAYLAAVAHHFEFEINFGRLMIQLPKMSDLERVAFLQRFEQMGRAPVFGFVVMGGIFGESLDLSGDRLTDAVIIGLGIPQISPDRDAVRGWFSQRGEPGFDYAYLYPGLARVMQAAGRVIRSATDTGRVLLIDRRFSAPEIIDLLPPWWTPRLLE